MENETVLQMFEDFIDPGSITVDKNGRLCYTPTLSIQVGRSAKLCEIMSTPLRFNSYPIVTRNCLLDLLYLILRRSSYDVVRFQCFQGCGSGNLTRVLLDLYFRTTDDANSGYAIRKRLIRLIGVAGASVINVEDLHALFSVLKRSSDLHLPMLQAIRMMMKTDAVTAKAAPRSFFNFGGDDSGLYSVLTAYPFQREYQIFTWFRVESFAKSSSESGSRSIVCISSSSLQIDIYIDGDRFLCVAVSDGKGDTTVLTLRSHRSIANTVGASTIGYASEREAVVSPLRRGAWYHISVRHTRPRLSLFNSDEMVIHLDHKLVFQGSVKFPQPPTQSSSSAAFTELAIGQNFDGQIAPIYFLTESVSPQVVEYIAMRDAGKDSSPHEEFCDLLHQITTESDRRTHVLAQKIASVYHPGRCGYGHALDIHGGRHARLGPRTFPTVIASAKSALASFGGVLGLLPMFPCLLIEGQDESSGGANQAGDTSVIMSERLTRSLYDLVADSLRDGVFSQATIERLQSASAEFVGDGLVGVLLSIVSSCVEGHAQIDQRTALLSSRAVEMIEYVFLHVSPAVFTHVADKKCQLALLHFRELLSESRSLEAEVTKRLLCNFNIWCRGSFDLQCSITATILADMASRPDYFLSLLGIRPFLTAVSQLYLDSHTIVSARKISSSSSSSSSKSKRLSAASFITVATPVLCAPSDPSNMSELQLLATGFTTYSLSASQRREMRRYMYSLIGLLIRRAAEGAEKELPHLLGFLCTCQDVVVTTETAQLLLWLLLEEGERVVSVVTELFKAPEDFIAFVLQTVVDHPREELRCTGIRILTHYCIRMDSVTSLKNAGLIVRTIEKLAAFSGDQNETNRLHSSGGLLLLEDLLCKYMDVSTSVLTYSVLLEMLLTKSNTASPRYHLIDAQDGPLSPLPTSSPESRGGSEKSSFLSPRSSRGALDWSIFVTHEGNEGFRALNEDFLMAHYLDAHMTFNQDSGEIDLVNPVILPCFLRVLQQMPNHILQQALGDLLLLLKHNTTHRDAITACPLWHVSLFSIMLSFLPEAKASSASAVISTDNIMRELERRSRETVRDDVAGARRRTSGRLLRSWGSSAILPPAASVSLTEQSEGMELPHSVSGSAYFSIGLAVYSILLQHTLLSKGGWSESMRCLSLAWSGTSLHGTPEHSNASPSVDHVRVAQVILVGHLREASSSVRNGYDELKNLLKAKDTKKISEAVNRLENILTLFVLSAEFALGACSASTDGLSDWSTCEIRLKEIDLILEGIRRNARRLSASAPKVKEVDRLRELSADETAVLRDAEVLSFIEKRVLTSLISSKEQLSSSKQDFGVDSSFIPVELTREWAAFESTPSSSDKSDKPSKRSSLILSIDTGDNSYPQCEPTFGDVTDGLASAETNNLFVIIDTLDLFDSLFWSSEESELRNAHLLEECIVGPVNLGMRAREAGARFGFTVDALAGTSDASKKVFRQETLSIHFTAIELSLRLFHTLAPWHPAALKNLRRLRVLIRALSPSDKDKPGESRSPSTPLSTADEWLVAAVVNVVNSLQSLALALEPLYTLMGIKNFKLAVPAAGFHDTEMEGKDGAGRSGTEDEDDAVFSSVKANAELTDRLASLFDSAFAENVVLFLQLALLFVSDVAQGPWADRVWEKNLAETDVAALRSFVTEIDYHLPRSDQQSRNVPTQTRNRSPTSFKRAMSVVSLPHELSLRPRPASGHGELLSALGREDTADMFLEAVEVRSSDKVAQFAPLKIVDDTTTTVISVLRLLSHRFIVKCNLHHGPRVARVLSSLRRLELTAANNSVSEMVAVCQRLTEFERVSGRPLFPSGVVSSSSVASVSSNESSVIRDLAVTTTKAIVAKEAKIAEAIKKNEGDRLKTMAVHWHESLRIFGDEWTPWVSPSTGSSVSGSDDAGGISTEELSKEFDNRLFRFILSKSDDIRDHRDEAYFDMRRRASMSVSGPADLISDVRPSSLTSDTNRLGVLAKAWVKQTGQKVVAAGSWADIGATVGGHEDSIISQTEVKSGSYDNDVAPHAAGFDISALLQRGSGNSSNSDRLAYTQIFQISSDEKAVFFGEATIITLESRILGEILLTGKLLYFHPRELASGHGITSMVAWANQAWAVEMIAEMHGRRYLQQKCAIELFFTDNTQLLLAFAATADLQRFFRALRRLSLPLLTQSSLGYSLNPQQAAASAPWTDLWRRRLISNFEYLMRLNILAGRSYNDITQYPVFPWILADYTSEKLDLNNPASFRDLSKPMGALDPERLQYFTERYRSFERDSPLGPAFFYGSHYSTEGYVVYYLIRQEPFTSLAVKLQGGRFDCPDRLFFDIGRTYEGSSRLSVSDVKELIPEFFCCPEMFTNSSSLPLGELQEGGQVWDVILPPWATDAHSFVRQHRDALECEYVSAHLHEWIDLIFGFKQVGQAAVDAYNVYHHLTYEDCGIVLDEIEEEEQREAVKAQVLHYGQTPSQLFGRPHPTRLDKDECMVALCSEPDPESLQRLQLFTPKRSKGSTSSAAVVALRSAQDKLIVVHADLCVAHYKWNSFPDADGMPFQIRFDKVKTLPNAALSRTEDALTRYSFVPRGPASADSADRHGSGVSAGLGASGSDAHKKQVKSTVSARQMYRNVAPRASISAASTSDSVSSPVKANSESASLSACPGGTEDASNSGWDSIETEKRHRRSNSSPIGPKRSPFMKSEQISVKNTNFFDAIKRGITELASPREKDASPPPTNFPTDVSTVRSPVATRRDSYLLSEHLFDADLIGDSRSLKQTSAGFHTAMLTSLPTMTHRLVALLPPEATVQSTAGQAGVRVVTVATWDSTLKIYAADTMKLLTNVPHCHRGAVTCMLQGCLTDGQVLITAGEDGVCRVWASASSHLATAHRPSSQSAGVTHQSGNVSPRQTTSSPAPSSVTSGMTGASASSNSTTAAAVNTGGSSGSMEGADLVCIHTLLGHQAPICAISYSVELDLLLSGDSSGVICTHALRKGCFIRSIRATDVVGGRAQSQDGESESSGAAVNIVLASQTGYLVSHSWATRRLRTFWVNGQQLASVRVECRIQCLAVNGTSLVLVSGDADGLLTFRSIWDLRLLRIVDHGLHRGISALWFTEDMQYLLIGSEDGTFSVGTDPNVRWKMLHAAIQKTPLLGPAI